MTSPSVLVFPASLQAPGTESAAFVACTSLADLPPGAMLRVTRGDLDVLIAHTSAGLVATDDRCPHMSAPLSVGELEGCVVRCPLHRGAFDLRDGSTVVFPTTGGLDSEGIHHPTWAPPDAAPKPAPTDSKAQARALTRVRLMRFYPLRVRGDVVEVALPA